MANLLSNTTIGGYQSIHTGNIGSYALTSVPANVITTSGGQTIGGTTYFSGGESLNVYGIRGRFTNEYMHLYHKVGIGHPGGWGQGEGNTPGYGLSVYGGANFAYGNNADSTFNGIVYSTASFRAPIYYDSQNTNYYGDFASTSNLNVLYTNYLYIDGTNLTGTQTQLLKNTLDVTTLPYKVDITVNGDANTFYAVQFWGGDQDVWRRIIIKRGYGETAPWDPIGTGVHHGGLLLDWEGNFGGWGGAEYADRIRVFNESYTNVCADMFIYSHSMGYVFMLRGGGAVYHLFSDQPINGFYQSGAPDILYSTSTLSYDDTWSGTNQYDVPAPAPLSLAQVNSSRIDGLRTKKQSLLDNRYLRQGIDISGIGTVTATNFLATNAFYLNGTSYYLNSTNGGIYTNARFETAGNLVVQGTTFLGNANGDEVHINDVLRLGATDSGDAHFFFGEGSSAGSDYGSHWYWDSAYTFNWYTRNAGTDTALFSYTTNDAYYVNWYRNFNMQNKHIHYINEAHFNGGTRFSTNDSHYLNFMTDATDYGAIRVISSTGALKGHLGHYDSNGFGLLNSSGNWGIRLNPGNAETLLFYAGNEKLRTDSAGAYVTGRLDVSSYVYTPGAIIANNIQGGYQVLNLDTIKNPGLYQYDGGIGGTQPLGTDWYNVKTIEIGSDGRYSQFVMPYSNNRIFYRSQVGGTWLSYVELITSGNIGSQSVNYATTAGALSSMNISQFTNNSGYITSGDTTTGIFTTYLGNGTSNISSGYTRVIRNENGAGGNPNYAPILHVAAGDTMWQIAGAHAGQTTLVWRSGYNGAWNTPWWTIYHSGNFTDNSSNWNTAFGWGNHASAGYLTSGSLSGYATQSWVNSQGFLTSVPAQSQLISPNGATVVAADSAMPNAGHSFIHSLALGPGGNDGHILGMSWAGTNSVYGAQIFLDTDPNDIMAIRSRSSAGVWTSWKTVIHSGTIGSQSVSYATTAGSAPNGGNVNSSYDVAVGNGNGLRFWGGSDSYKISMGVGALYQYGPVTDYSIKTQMNDSSTDRGFTWGRISYAPIAALNSTSGDMQIAGSLRAAGHLFTSYNGSNILLRSADNTSDAGILVQNSGGSFKFQIYGNGGDYGFLNGNWAGWDIRKTVSGAMYMNGDNGYYLHTNSTSNFYALNIQGNAVVHAGNIGSQSVSNANTVGGYLPAQTYTSTGNAAGSYLGGHYASGGTELPNSGTFGAGKLKLAMISGGTLGFGGSWNDVLWLSSYNGGDVKSSHALVFDKYSTNVWVSDQNYDSAAWGTGYLLLSTANYNSYSPTLTGTGASGTWGINVTGTAARATRANGNFYIDDNYGNTIVGLYNSTILQGVFAMGDAYKLTAGGGAGNLYGLAWSHPNAGGVASNLNTHGLLVMENGTFLAAISGSIRARDDMRAPIFYDSNDTTYYLDPNSNSYLSTLRVANATSGVSLHVGLGSTHGVYTADNDRKYLVVSATYYPHMALVATSSNNSNHGAVFSFVGSESGAARQWNMGIANSNPFVFSIGYNRTGDNNPHYGIGDGWHGDDNHHARLSIDRDGNTKIRGMLYINGTSGGISTGSAVIHAGNIGSQSVSYASTAGSLSSMNISQFTNNSGYITSSSLSSYLPLAGGTMTGKIFAPSFGSDAYGGAFEIRERGFVSNGQSDWSYSPAISFHWGNRHVQRFGVRADGLFAIDDAPIALRSWVSSQGFLTSINSTQVTNALGYTPYNSSNPNGYVTSSGSVNYATTAGSAPANGGNSSTVGGYSVSVGASANTIPTRNASGYLIPESWIQFNGTYGLYSPTNGAHLRPNDGSYGPWLVTGTRNGWNGIEFNASNGNVSLMVNPTSNTTGFHNNAYGWQFYWESGTLYCHKNAYGAGAQATVLDSSNYSSWAQPIASAINTGNIGSQSVSYASSAGSAGSVSGLTLTSSANGINPDSVTQNQIGYNTSVSLFGQTDGGLYSSAYSSAWIHQIYGDFRTGQIAVRGKNSGTWQSWRTVLDSSNYTSYSPSLIGSGASGTWGINVTGSAGSVAWTNVSSRPTALSQFTNDLGNYGGFLTSLGFSYSTGVTGNHVVQRDANGYIYANHVNFNTSETENPTISSFITSNGDGWSRKSSIAHVRNQLGNYGGWLTTSGKAADSELIDGIDSSRIIYGDGSFGSTNYSDMNNTAQKSGFFFYNQPTGNPFGDWTHWINCMGNSWNPNYGFQLAHAFHSNNFAVRVVANGGFSSWRTIIDSGNIGSQSVNYASSAGSAGSATNAGQLNTYGYLVGENWDTYYTSGKLRVASASGATGVGRPPSSVHNYGSLLSYGISGEDMFQMYFPDNAGNSIANSRKLHYRTGRGAWCDWRTVVDMVGDTLTIVEGGTPKIVVRGSVPYGQATSASIELVGDADGGQTQSYRWISNAPDWSGQELRLERKVNNSFQLVGRVPKNTNNLEWQGTIVQGLSDSRVKTNVVSMTEGLDKIDQIRPVTFDWVPTENVSDREGADFGFIAQELEEVLPEVVHTRGDGYKTVMYEKVVPVLVQAMKEQQALIEALRAEVELLKNK